MSTPLLFSNNSVNHQPVSQYLVEFRAGKMTAERTGPKKMMLKPVKERKGLLYVQQTDDQLMHFCWKDRQTGHIEDDLIIFPGDIEFKKISQCKTGRVFVLKFKSNDRRLFFWSQEPKVDKDDDYVTKINDYLNNPPVRDASHDSNVSNDHHEAIDFNELLHLPRQQLHDRIMNMSQNQVNELMNSLGMPPPTTEHRSRPRSPSPQSSQSSSSSSASSADNRQYSGQLASEGTGIQLNDLQRVINELNASNNQNQSQTEAQTDPVLQSNVRDEHKSKDKKIDHKNDTKNLEKSDRKSKRPKSVPKNASKSDIKTATKIQSKTETKDETKTLKSVKSQTKIPINKTTKSLPKIEIKSKSKSKPKDVSAKIGSKSDLKTTDHNISVKKDPKSDLKIDSKSVPKIASNISLKSDPKSDLKFNSKSAPKTGLKIRSKSDSKSGLKSDSKSDLKNDFESDKQIKIESKEKKAKSSTIRLKLKSKPEKTLNGVQTRSMSRKKNNQSKDDTKGSKKDSKDDKKVSKKDSKDDKKRKKGSKESKK
ncbi:uncharacterized protein LOC128965320 [Oppia nitens]|uniref:uncharacterized protein LOC128965320 n=1 Tax=Oppia nitens TaxID=1686743 RepID=UPI0023DC901E|nr:uncharacterized protein LOC128965320 [Oppia nitens]